MRKAIVSAFVASILFGAGAVLASTNITFLTLNGGPNATIPLGATAQANVQYDLVNDMTTSDTESLSWQLLDGAGNAALPPVCVDIPDRTTAGTFNASFPIGTGGQSEGNWDIRVRLYGTPGTGANNQCGGAFTSSHTFQNVLTLDTPDDSNNQTNNPFPGSSTGFCALFPADCVSGTTGSTGPTGLNYGVGQTGSSLSIFCQLHPVLCGNTSSTGHVGNSGGNNSGGGYSSTTPPSWFVLWLATWNASHPSTPPANAHCAAFKANLMASSPNMRTPSNAVLQGFLIGVLRSPTNPTPIPALAQGASFGFYGPQTAAAVALFQSMYNCQ